MGLDKRSSSTQAGYQLAALAISLGMGVVTGVFGGFIASRSFFQSPSVLFHDEEHWHEVEVPEEVSGEYNHCANRVDTDSVPPMVVSKVNQA